MESLPELENRRRHDCRLTQDRALGSLDEAVEFLRDRGLLTRTADSSLPSLYEACHEDPYAPGRGGFGQWPATKWPWFGELAELDDVYLLKVHRGKNLLVTADVASLLDPICRSELARMEASDPDWARLLGHLADAGPSSLEDLQIELGLKPKELKLLRSPLERCGAVVTRELVLEAGTHGHAHTSELARWDQLFPESPRAPDGPGDLLVAAVRAAVVAPEKELRRWFSWPWLVIPELVEGLVAEGRLERPEPGWISAVETASR